MPLQQTANARLVANFACGLSRRSYRRSNLLRDKTEGAGEIDLSGSRVKIDCRV